MYIYKFMELTECIYLSLELKHIKLKKKQYVYIIKVNVYVRPKNRKIKSSL